jgi:site-specific recombinase XerD
MTATPEAQILALYRRWWTVTQRRSVDTVDHYLREIALLQAFLAGTALVDADRLTIEAFVADRTELSSHTGRWAYRAVRSMYAWMADRELVAVNPTANIRGPKEVKNPNPPTATTATFDALIASIAADADRFTVRDIALVTTLWGTGMRRGELIRMQAQHLDLDAQTLLIPITKTGRPRMIPLLPVVLDALMPWLEERLRWRPDTDHVWLGRHRGRTVPMTANGARLMLERRRRAAGVHLSSHAFRRGGAAHFLRSGISQTSVEQIFGWTPGSPMVAQYVRAVAAELAHDEVRRAFGN